MPPMTSKSPEPPVTSKEDNLIRPSRFGVFTREGELLMIKRASHLTLLESGNPAYREAQRQLQIAIGNHQAAMSCNSLILNVLSQVLTRAPNAHDVLSQHPCLELLQTTTHLPASELPSTPAFPSFKPKIQSPGLGHVKTETSQRDIKAELDESPTNRVLLACQARSNDSLPLDHNAHENASTRLPKRRRLDEVDTDIDQRLVKRLKLDVAESDIDARLVKRAGSSAAPCTPFPSRFLRRKHSIH
ncbi:hypothetical protein NP233_g10358 [Leucocoprinus birnbaumii]|uniref:Uncharacterized protein n=1 Tax=Leucocoprinus birnbaumii TaxID=56174 RepID=A0AAD5VIQ3_9AGAR|nr:hypothetical protein NP233_g10358 [Leucocoprinus birnbaumii]